MQPAEPLRIGEEELAQAQPAVRALIVARYERVWTVVESSVRAAEADERPVDPRLLEIGVRVTRELAALYRLAQPPRVPDDDELPLGGLDRRAAIEESLAEIAKRAEPAGGSGT